MDVAGAFLLGAVVGMTVGVILGALGIRMLLRRRDNPSRRNIPSYRNPPGNPDTSSSRNAPAQSDGAPHHDTPLPRDTSPTQRQAAMPQAATPSAPPTEAAPDVAGPAGGAQTGAQTTEDPPGPFRGLAALSLEVLRAGVVLLDAEDQVVFGNPSARHLGLIHDVAGHPTVSHSVLRSLAARVRRSGNTRDVELELPRAGGEPLGVRVRMVALEADHVAVEVEDMTEVHRVGRVRRDFVANVSHELKTPVGALQLLSEALLDATDDPEAARRFAERIQHESTRLGRLVSELLELSRLQGGEPLPQPELVTIDRIVNEVLDRSRTTASAKEITVQLAGRRGLKLYGHERLLVTAVANLVDNAIAYSPDSTIVTISAERTGDDVEISVTDEGIGIAEQDQGRIFERFYRADPARSRATGGTGLGLAIVKHIATNHGGQVSVHSSLGNGSTFTLRLPSGHPGGAPALHRTGELDAALIPRKTQGPTSPTT
ncbi:MAG: ATP-binding protein, partial [Micromonosporaceae bacterium]